MKTFICVSKEIRRQYKDKSKAIVRYNVSNSICSVFIFKAMFPDIIITP